jgi:hypothetical protein
MVFFKKRKKEDNLDKDQDWNKDIKRNRAIGNNAVQQGFDFEIESYTERDKALSGTKYGLSLNEYEINEDQIKVLLNCREENTAEELIKILKRTNKTKFKNDILNPLIEFGFFERTIPEKPKSPKQKYRLTGLFVKKRSAV